MNAVRLYVSAARLILENEHYDYVTCKQIQNVFPSLEQSLTCTVCRQLLNDPYSPPVETNCQHHVCKNCIGGLKKLKPSCSWCKDYDKYTKNTQLQSLLMCYKGLCHYIKCTNLLTQLADFCGLVNNATPKTTMNQYLLPRMPIKTEFCSNMVKYVDNALNDTRKEATAVSMEHTLDKSLRKADNKRPETATIKIMYPSSRLRSNVDDGQAQRFNGDNHRPVRNREQPYPNSSKRLYSVTFAGSEGTRNKLILRRKNPPIRIRPNEQFLLKRSNTIINQSQFPAQHGQNSNSSGESSLQYRPTTTILRNNADRPNCRCGNATPKPGKLTCCGQRCACYMQSKACAGCRCRGCRNPHMVDGVKILRRFVRDRHQHHQNTNSPAVMPNNTSTSSFENSSANFFNKSMNQVSPILPQGAVSNTI